MLPGKKNRKKENTNTQLEEMIDNPTKSKIHVNIFYTQRKSSASTISPINDNFLIENE